MTRWEDLPPVDIDGWLADQGRDFLQRTDQQISRLGLPGLLDSVNQKIRGLQSNVSSLLDQGEQTLSDRLAATRQQVQPPLQSAASSLVSSLQPSLQAGDDFLASTTDRINSLGSSLGGGLSDLGSGISGIGDALRVDPSALLERGRNTNVFDLAGSGLDWVDERFPAQPGGSEDQRVGRQASRLGGRPSQQARAVRSGTAALRESLKSVEEGRSRVAGSEAQRQESLARGNVAGANLAALGGLGNTVMTAGDAIAAPFRAGGAAYAGGTLPPGSNRNLAGLPGDTPVLGGLLNPVQATTEAGGLLQGATLIDDLLGVALRRGIPVTRRGIEILAQALPESEVRRLFDQGVDAVATALRRFATEESGALRLPGFGRQPAAAGAAAAPLEDEATRLARAVAAAEQRFGRPLDSFEIEAERGFVRRAMAREAQAPQAPPPPTPSAAPTPAAPGESARARLLAPRAGTALDDMQRTRAMLRAQKEAVPEVGKTGSVLDTFRSRTAGLREKWIDENARVADVQAAIQRALEQGGGTLSKAADVVSGRRLFAGRRPASEQQIMDNVRPVIEDLTEAQRDDVDTLLISLDQAEKARAVGNRVENEALGRPLRPVAGATAARGAQASLRARRQVFWDAAAKAQDAEEALALMKHELAALQKQARDAARGVRRGEVQRVGPYDAAGLDDALAEARLAVERQTGVVTGAKQQALEAARKAGVKATAYDRAALRSERLRQLVEEGEVARDAERAIGAAEQGAQAEAGRIGPGNTLAHSEAENAASFRELVRERLEAEAGQTVDAATVDAEVALLKERAAQLQDYSRTLRERQHEAGLMDDDLFAYFKTHFPNYVRGQYLDNLAEGAETVVSGGPQQFSVNTLKTQGVNLAGKLSEEGSAGFREGPTDTLIRMTGITEDLVRRNQVATALRELVRSDPTGELQATFRPLKNAEEALKPGEVRFGFYENGKPQYFAVPMEYQSLFQMEPSAVRQGFQTAGNLLGAPLLKAGATTYNPGFIALNALRDAQVYLRRTGGFTSLPKLGESLRDLGFAYRDLYHSARAGTEQADWAALAKAGGSQNERFTRGGKRMTPAEVQRTIANEDPSLAARMQVAFTPGEVGSILADVFRGLGSPVKAAGEVVESAPRLAAYRRALREGKTEEEAALAARDITLDFSRGGTWARNLNALVPFLNAAIQGNERFIASDLLTKANRKNTAAALFFGGVAPAVAFEAYNRLFGQDYQDVPDYLKDSGIVIMIPDQLGGAPRPGRRADGTTVPGQRQFIYLPLPQDAALLKGVTTRALRQATGEEPGSLQRFATQTLGDLSPIPLDAGFPLPPVARTAMELGTNRDIFRGRDIVPDYIETRPQGEQATEQTSAAGRVIGGALSAAGIPGTAPAQIDYAVESLLGGPGRAALRASDVAARALGQGDLASRQYSTPEEPGLMDAVRGIPALGDVPGRVLRNTGGQLQDYAARRLKDEGDRQKAAVKAQLERSPAFRRLPAAVRQRQLDAEYRKIDRQLQEQAADQREADQARRVQAQRVQAQRRAG